MQLIYNLFIVLDTLALEKQISRGEFTKSISSINPFSFLKLYRTPRYPKAKKHLVTIYAIQCGSEGRATAEAVNTFGTVNVGWSNEQWRNVNTAFGGSNICLLYTSPSPRD